MELESIEIENKCIKIESVNDILEVVKICDLDYRIYNSNMTIEYSEKCEKRDFEPIVNIYESDNNVEYSWNDVEAISNFEFIDKLKLCNNINGLNRDIEDGYVYSDYDNIIIRNDLKIIVLL